MTSEFTYPIATLDQRIAIAAGQIPGASFSGKASVREGIGLNDTEDIWAGLTAIIPDLASPERMVIVSDDAGDTAAGVGARSIVITGLDLDLNPIVELMALNGTTPVTTSQLYLRVNAVFMQDAGSNMANLGTITFTSEVTVLEQDRILPVNGAGCSTRFTVPTGHTMIMQSIIASSEKDDEISVDMRLKTPTTGLAYITAFPFLLNTGPLITPPLFIPIREQSDLKFRATAATNNAKVTLAYTFILLEN